ncbi:MAG: 4-hydroxythreonine-4-phosphate dehydrogenase PdxA [Verrucomicrobiales bacterium]|nr:4-hydroxythreonine-4-phosphate dehydrogenase PdxA [Verrucomicrobiales bacterium]
MSLPRIAVTMGDPAGVGPEICLDLLSDENVASCCVPIVFGDRSVPEACAEKTGKAPPAAFCDEAGIEAADRPCVFHIESIGLHEFQPGAINAATGRAAYTYITKSIDLALAGLIDGVATAPINKEALSSAGITQPGHTEIFAERSGTERYCMMLTSEIITCSLVTIHVGYHEVPELLSEARILEVIELTREAMTRIRGREPKIVVCGLNPHAGENGLFGNREEERIILPAIESARKAGANVEGPLPPDTAFLKWRRAETDAYVCMYHDQGLIPLKALAFDEAINTTLGLPIVRTSVDHGTALDIAWQGKANHQSLIEAVRLAAKMSHRG